MTDRDGIDIAMSRKLADIEKNWSKWLHRTTDFETNFVAGHLTRYRVYGSQIVMSAKQRNILTEIYEKIKD